MNDPSLEPSSLARSAKSPVLNSTLFVGLAGRSGLLDVRKDDLSIAGRFSQPDILGESEVDGSGCVAEWSSSCGVKTVSNENNEETNEAPGKEGSILECAVCVSMFKVGGRYRGWEVFRRAYGWYTCKRRSGCG